MISTRGMDIKLRETAEGIGEDSTGKKKSKFKTFKKFFGKKKRKASPSSTGSSTWKQSQTESEVTALDSGPVGYDSEDELEESRGALGSRALSHDSIFIPESGQDPTRPVRVFSQENVCDRIKALQLKIQCNVKMGPPPPPGGLPIKRGDDAGMSSEDDGLPSSPPEMSLLHDVGCGTTIKVSLVSSSQPLSLDHVSDTSVSPRTSDSSIAPMADFSYPPEFSSCLDNSAAKHKLLVKPRNQRSSKMRRLSSRAQSESLSDLTCTPEEEEHSEKVSMEENPSSRQQGLEPDRGTEPGEPATMLLPGGTRARRARLRHCPALSVSMEEESLPADEPPGHLETPEVTEPESGPALCLEPPSPPECSSHHDPDNEEQREELSIPDVGVPDIDTADEVCCASRDSESEIPVCVPEENVVLPETITVTTLEMPSSPDGPDQCIQKEVELPLDMPSPEGAGTEPSVAPAPSPQVPKSCLKHKALSVSVSHSMSPIPPASESPPGEDKEVSLLEQPKTDHSESLQGGPTRAPPERKTERGSNEMASVKKFSVSSCRARLRTNSARLLEQPSPGGPPTVRLPLLKSSLAWKSEAALDELQVVPEPHNIQQDPQKPPSPVECASEDSGDQVANQALLDRSTQDGATIPATKDPCPATQELAPCEDRNPFPIKLRSTSLSLKYRDGSSSELRGIKRYSAEIRLEKGGLTLLSKDEKCQIGATPNTRGARSLNDQGKVKARSSEQLSSKPPLPRKPLLQALTLPYPPTPSLASLGELEKTITLQDSKKENKTVEKKSAHRIAEKGLSPANVGPGADGQPMPPWITIARQKRRGVPDLPPNQEDRLGVWNLKSEMDKQPKAPERAQVSTKQGDFVRSKSFLIAPAKPSVERKHGTKLSLKEGLQRGISLSHQNLVQSAGMTEKELNQLKRASYASADQPSWMELARKKSQAWSDMPQIIK
ncbi:PREDICTED: uncharacterized protein KIAA1211-like homolog [Chrysochloris asiatica]|uniref:Uncharacterized protein KIAA1211-like homolog n=1 Tax=Chrysochloris asiatica TaxID=185453 RepID=A0A9B0WUR1_CHRAS|nr:PREDICTED: uncharacterized protein KIAA1211-like homolog [Chrysochloris asiatica]